MNHRRICCAVTVSLALVLLQASCAGPHTANPTEMRETRAIEPDEFLKQFAATYRFRLGRPTAITVTPNGESVLFLRSGPRSFVQDLYEFDLATGRERVLLTADAILGGGEEKLTAEELARRERMRMASRGIASYSISKDGSRLLVPLSGKLFVIDRAGGQKREIPSNAGGFPIDPRLSRDGSLIACVRDGELYVTDIASGAEHKITSGTTEHVTFGLAEFVAQEEMSRFEGFWIAPDNSAILYQRTDTSALETFSIADPVDPSKAAETWPYPRPGKNNADVSLFLQPLGPGGVPSGAARPVTWDRAAYPYLATVKWQKDAPITLLVQNREQTKQELLAVNSAGGTDALLVETDPAWINIEQAVPEWLPGENGASPGFLWMSEREGEWVLEQRWRDGSLVSRITPPGFGLKAFLHAEKNGVIYVAASRAPDGTLDPTQTHVWRLNTRARIAPMPVTEEAGVHGGQFADDADVWVQSAAYLAGGSKWIVRRGGERVGELTSTAERPSLTPSVELASVGSREYRVSIVRPRNFDAAKQYPVLVSVYGGPGISVVNANRDAYVLQQWMADAGFIVVGIDGRGTPNRGREWERAIKNDLITIPLADQAEALRALRARVPQMDLSRVGIYGWSFGGYFSAHAVMQMPETFHVGVAGAPVADFADYDTHYTERYLGLPAANPKGYEQSNVLTHAKDLKRPLLIIHGTADDNVYFMHSLKMTQTLFRAGREFDFLPLSGFTHMVPDPVVTERLQSRMREYFVEHLKP
jgi:dipeptidyl-peptidase 4